MSWLSNLFKSQAEIDQEKKDQEKQQKELEKTREKEAKRQAKEPTPITDAFMERYRPMLELKDREFNKRSKELDAERDRRIQQAKLNRQRVEKIVEKEEADEIQIAHSRTNRDKDELRRSLLKSVTLHIGKPERFDGQTKPGQPDNRPKFQDNRPKPQENRPGQPDNRPRPQQQ